jgi:hypothetical protein
MERRVTSTRCSGWRGEGEPRRRKEEGRKKEEEGRVT